MPGVLPFLLHNGNDGVEPFYIDAKEQSCKYSILLVLVRVLDPHGAMLGPDLNSWVAIALQCIYAIEISVESETLTHVVSRCFPDLAYEFS